jgi:hypothetical protein
MPFSLIPVWTSTRSHRNASHSTPVASYSTPNTTAIIKRCDIETSTHALTLGFVSKFFNHTAAFKSKAIT